MDFLITPNHKAIIIVLRIVVILLKIHLVRKASDADPGGDSDVSVDQPE